MCKYRLVLYIFLHNVKKVFDLRFTLCYNIINKRYGDTKKGVE